MRKVKLLLLVAALLLSVSCHRKKQENTVRIGAVLPLSGNLSQVGESGRTGLLMAEDYINNRYKKKMKIIFEDGKGNPTVSVNAANKLISFDKVDKLFSIVSSVDLSIVPIQEKDSFLMFSHASHPDLSNINSLFFRHSQTVSQEVDFILSQLDSGATITVCYMNDDYGVAFNKELKSKALGNHLVGSISFLPSETNFASLAKKIIDFHSDKVVICAGGKNIADLVRKMKEQNYSGDIITTLAYVVSGAGEATRDVKGLSMVDFKQITYTKEFGKYVKEFESRYGKKVGTAEIMFFNSAWIVYVNSLGQSKLENIASKIKKSDSINIFGNTVVVTESNDILPELTLIKQ